MEDMNYNFGGNGNSGKKAKKVEKITELSFLEQVLLYLNETILFVLPLFIIIASLALAIFGKNGSFTGLAIIVVGIMGYVLYNTFKETPEKEVWLISAFKRYYTRWLPGLHFLPYPIMRIDHKITINATKVFDIFMREGSHKLEFNNGSAGLSIKVLARAMNPYKAGYEISITDKEIDAIEIEEKDKGITRLPERWMYFTAVKVEAVARGICGNMSIDEAIQAKVFGDSEEETELRINSVIIEKVISIAIESLKDYEIKIEQITFSAITLSDDIEKARDAIYIEEQAVLKQEQTLKKQMVEAKGEKVRQEGIKKGLYELVSDQTDEKGNVLKKSDMTLGDAMQFELTKSLTTKVGDVTIISSGNDNIPENTAASFGAKFGAGFNAGTNKKVDNRKNREDKEDDE